MVDYITKPIDFGKLLPIHSKYLRKDQSLKGKQGKLLPPLPTKLRRSIVESLETLLNFPIFETSDIIDQISKIQELCQGFHSFYPEVLKKVEQTVYEGDEEHFQKLIEETILRL